ncbi:Hypothetical protein, putative [Bodo saltans]|uniref:RNA-binding protein n=1 Tax=Bodo saltans TaxID=75058 RepID=A0A0S4IJJ1_BODSA|nr:Hypothetical protein, putative [Bodo saltans]|eukprot:CUE87394.1 Hypothetical protein, putative [Bodo saltans]
MDRDPAPTDEFDMLSSLLQAAREVGNLQAQEDSEVSSRAIGAFRVTAGGGQSPDFGDALHSYMDDAGTRTPPAATQRGTPRTAVNGGGGGFQRNGLNATATPFLTRQQTPPHHNSNVAAPQGVMFSPYNDHHNYNAQLATWPPPHGGGSAAHHNLHPSLISSSPAAGGATTSQSGAARPTGGYSHPSHPPFHQQVPPSMSTPQFGGGSGNNSNNNNNTTTQHDAMSLEWIQQFAHQHPHLIAVLNLEPRTSHKQLWDIFYPMGATDAAVMGSGNIGGAPGSLPAGAKRGVGVVMFSSADMAKIAAEKMNDFVPHGQSFPLVASYVPPPSSARSFGGSNNVGNLVTQQHTTTTAQQSSGRDRFGRPIGGGAPPSSQPSSVANSVNTSSITAESNGSSHGGGGGGQASSSSSSSAASAIPQQYHDGIPDVTPEMSNASLLSVFVSVISRRGLGSDDIATILLRILCRQQSTKTLVDETVTAIRHHLQNMGSHSTVLIAPLARALQYLSVIMEAEHDAVHHFTATLPPPSASLVIASANRSSPATQQLFASFKIFLSQTMLQLFFDSTAEKTCRVAAGVLIGYLFDLGFIGGAPFEMASKLLTTNHAAFFAAQEYANAGSDPTDPKATQHEATSHLIDALSAMTSSWASRNPSRAPDSSEELFQAFLGGFTFSRDHHDVTGSTDVSRSSLANRVTTPRGGHGEGLQQQRRTPPPTPSSSHASGAVGYSPSKVHPSLLRPGTTSPSSEVAAGDLSTDSVGSGTGGYSVNTPGIWQPPQRLVTPAQQQQQASSTSFTFETTLQKDLLACTVYLTKLPGGLTDAKIRRLVAHFGEFNKVRMYKEKTPPALRGGAGGTGGGSSQQNRGCLKKKPPRCAFREFNKVRMYKEKTPPALRGGAGSTGGGSSQQNRGCFGFVEYAQPSSAKAVIDYFRNASMTSNNAFHFLIGGELSTAFTIDEIGPLSLTRASYAKSAIHDQHPKDAIFEPIVSGSGESPAGATMSNGQPNVKVQSCMFGLMGGESAGSSAAAVLQQQHHQHGGPPSSSASTPFGQHYSQRPQSLQSTPQRTFRPLDSYVDPAVVPGQTLHNSSMNTTTSSVNSNDQPGAFKLGLFDTDSTW